MPTRLKQPTENLDLCERLAVDPPRLLYASLMTAKVDSADVQDEYQFYERALFLPRPGSLHG
jgi:hypothetical protein